MSDPRIVADRPTAPGGTRGDPRLVLAAASMVQLLVSLDISVVNVGLPQIGRALGFVPADLSWVIHAYALTFGGLLLLGGKAADRYGRRRVLLVGLVIFGLASFAAGLALSPGQLVAGRAVQGIGAAALQPASLALLSATFPSGAARARAFGIWSATNALGGALGVLLGGVLTEYAGWRWVMFVNLPLVLVAVLLAGHGIAPDGPRRSRTGLDLPGAVLATAGMGLLVYGIAGTAHRGWGSPTTVLTLAAALVLLAGFVAVEARRRGDRLLRLGLLSNRSVAGANLCNLLLGAGIASTFYFVSLYVQGVLGKSPAVTGLMFLPFALGVVGGSFLAIRLGARYARRSLIVTGALVTATGFAWFGFISPDGSFLVDVLGPSLVASVGFGICLGPVVSTGTVGVAAAESGTASSLLSSTRQLGATLGLAVLGSVAVGASNGSVSPEALTLGYARGLSVAATLLVLAAVVALLGLPREPDSGPDAGSRRAGAAAAGQRG